MFNFLNFRIDWFSYLAGLLTGLLAAGVIALIRILLPKLRQGVVDRIKAARMELLAGTELHLRNDAIRQAQGMHIAAPLFALDEVLVEPALLSPPPLIVPGSGLLEDSGNRVELPYMPDWPEMATAFHASTLSIPEAMSKGANLALIANPGMGKTTALAYLALLAARKNEEAGCLKDLLPILVHAADFSSILYNHTAQTQQEPLELLIKVVAHRTAVLAQPRLPNVMKAAFEEGSVLLLVDGMDEFPPNQVENLVDYLATLVKGYPKTRMVAALPPNYIDGSRLAGMVPVALAGWSERQRETYLERWSELWTRFIAPGIQEGPGEIDPLMLKGWISGSDPVITPLEFTLKLWAAFAGDSLGPDTYHSVEAYIRRTTVGVPHGREILECLAEQMIFGVSPTIGVNEAKAAIPELVRSLADVPTIPLENSTAAPVETTSINSPGAPAETTDAVEAAGEESGVEKQPETQENGAKSRKEPNTPAAQKAPRVHNPLTVFVENGILVKRKDERVAFSNPGIFGYLAGNVIVRNNYEERLNAQPEWSAKTEALNYLAGCVDLTAKALPILEDDTDPLYRNALVVGRWLKQAPSGTQWRGQAMKRFAGMLQVETYSLGLRARVVTALVASGDPGVGALFRQLFAHRHENIRFLAALGSGLARDGKAVNDIIQLLDDPSLKVGQAAVLALASIGTRPALEAIADTLMQRSEGMRRAAAEALAYLPEEGHPALKDGATMDDLLVRRAAVFGLAKVNQPWAEDLLQHILIEDKEWIVRSAVTLALEERARSQEAIPCKLPELTESPWLFEFAGKEGLGVAPGRPAVNLVIQAVKSDDLYEVMAALGYLERMNEAGGIPNIYQVLYSSGGELREAAYNALWHLALGGVDLPDPSKFGLG